MTRRFAWMMISVILGLMFAGPAFSAAKPGTSPDAPASQPAEKMAPSADTRRLDNTYYQWRTELPKPEGEVVSIDGPAALKNALAGAKGDETFMLAPGSYGSLSLRSRTFEKPLTLRSVDPKKPAVFSSMTLGNVAGLNVEDVEFRATPDMGQGKFFMLLRMDKMSRVCISHCFFIGVADAREGSKTKGYFEGMGLKGGNWKDVTVQQNEFTGLTKAISVNDIQNVKFLGNYIHDFRSDAFFMKVAEEVLVEGNLVEGSFPYHLPKGAGDHPDMIQASGLKNVTIRNNFFSERGGAGSQGIFIAGPAGKDADDKTDEKTSQEKADAKPGHVTVENNIIVVSMGNGISLSSLPDSVVRNNTLLYAHKNPPKPNPFTRLVITGDAKNVLLEKNLVDRIRFGSKDAAGITQKDNKVIQHTNAGAPDYYNAFFTGKPADGPVRLGDLQPAKKDQVGADFTPFEKYVKKTETAPEPGKETE